MQSSRFSCLFVLLLSVFFSHAQKDDVIINYINAYRNIAIDEMHRTGVPASIKLAQGIHETSAGTSELVKKSNNHFGIKCKSNWTGESVKHTDDAPHECFRKYEEPSQSYRDHSDFLKASSRYASLFTLDPLDYSAWAYGLKKAGYATNPRYPQIIIKLIEKYGLQDYTLIALGKMPPKQDAVAAITVEGSTAEDPAFATDPIVEKAIEPRRDYPAGEFKINNTRVVYLAAGISLLSVAQQYQIPLARIFEYNELEESETLPGDQLIYLQRKKKTGGTDFHVVKSGERLKDIAQEEAIRIESLLEYNHLQSNMQPAAGEKLYLRSKSPAMPKLVKTEVAANNVNGL